MANVKEFEGKDLAEALQAAASRLGIPEPDLDYEILDQGRRGLFGLGARSVRIRIMPPIESDEPRESNAPRRGSRARRGARSRKQPEDAKRPAAALEPKADKLTPEPKSAPRTVSTDPTVVDIQTKLQKMFELMQLEVNVTSSSKSESAVELGLEGRDVRKLTQKDGELIGAVQFILNRMARRSWPEAGRIRLSVNGRRGSQRGAARGAARGGARGGARGARRGGRRRGPRSDQREDRGEGQRDEDVVELTREVAQQVERTGQAKQLHAMNAYERRLVHLTAREFSGVGSRSEGEGGMKTVRIFKRDPKEQRQPESD